jgi:hypothetical protein
MGIHIQHEPIELIRIQWFLFHAIVMRDIRHCLGKYPFLGLNECPARFSESVIFYTSRCKDAPLLSQTIIQFVKLAFVFSPPARNRSSGTTVAQAELQLSAPDEQAGRCGPGTGWRSLFDDVTGPAGRARKRRSSTSSAFPPTRAAESCHVACATAVPPDSGPLAKSTGIIIFVRVRECIRVVKSAGNETRST